MRKLLIISFIILCSFQSCKIGVSCSYCINNKALKTTIFRCKVNDYQTFEKLEVIKFKNKKPQEYTVVGKISGEGFSNKKESKVTFSKEGISKWRYYKTIGSQDSLISTKTELTFEPNTWYKIKNLDNGGFMIVTYMKKIIYFKTNKKGKIVIRKKAKDPNSGGF